jgi:hypothetical protein
MNTHKISIEFPRDPSVGMFAEWYTMEIPNPINEEWSKEEKEELRAKIKSMYEGIDNDGTCRVYFENEC